MRFLLEEVRLIIQGSEQFWVQESGFLRIHPQAARSKPVQNRFL